MDTFAMGPGRTWFTRAMGHSALVRPIDRVEAWSQVVAVVILAVATSVVCAFGTSTYEDRSRTYSLEAQHRHLVTATAIEVGHPVQEPVLARYATHMRWSSADDEHVDAIDGSGRARIVDQQRIWVDDQGRRVPPPRNSSCAAVEASVLAFAVWLGLFSAVAGAMYAVRWLFDIRRFAQWDLEINQISQDGGRRNPQ